MIQKVVEIKLEFLVVKKYNIKMALFEVFNFNRAIFEKMCKHVKKVTIKC